MKPTPGGEPVKTTSPGFNVINLKGVYKHNEHILIRIYNCISNYSNHAMRININISLRISAIDYIILNYMFYTLKYEQ